MICNGRDCQSGAGVSVGGDATIVRVDPLPGPGDLWLSPGWIDIQVNGYAGVDYNDPAVTHERIGDSLSALFATGTTRMYPTVITGPPERMRSALANLAPARERLPQGPAMDGFHVEGPHISPEDGPRGAHPRAWVRPPDFDEFQRWQEAARGGIRIVTLAPEWPQATGYIERITRAGVVAAIGHTAAEPGGIADAVRAGATLSTHLGNGGHAVMRRHPNYIWEQLAEDRLMAGFIADGIHLPGSFLKAAIRAKDVSRCVLVTDAATPAGATPGRYRVGELEVVLTEDGRVLLADQPRLAGSALRMDRGIEKLMEVAGLSLAEALQMATMNPARAGNVPGRSRGLEPGERNDLVQFRYDSVCNRVEVIATYLAGEKVFG